MQVVVDIDEDTYKDIKSGKIYTSVRDIPQESVVAIANGTPLPKGHGKLIIEPTDEEIAKTIGGKNDFADCIREAVKTVFANAHTVIEADAPKKRKGTPIEENDSGYNCENWIP